MLDVSNPGSRESVVDPPVHPTLSLPPFRGASARAVEGKNAGDSAAVSPIADTPAKNSRRLMRPVLNIFSSSLNVDMIFPPLEMLP
jgi:hypothetical protein